MPFSLFGGLFSGLMNYGSSTANTHNTNMANLQAVRETNRQNLQLQHEAWAREDNAVQRRMADLQAGGLNPILAAGQGAQASAPVRMESPRFERPDSLAIEADLVERALRMRDEFATTRMNRQLMEKQAGLIEATTQEHRARARQIRQATSHETDYFQRRIDQMESIVALQGEQQALAVAQREGQIIHNRHAPDVNRAVVLDNVRREIENELNARGLENRVSQIEAELVAQNVANELAEHNLEQYKDLGYASTAGAPMNLLQTVRTQVNRFLDSIGIGERLRQPLFRRNN